MSLNPALQWGPALGEDNSTDTSYLFQRYRGTHWSPGEHFDELEEALLEQIKFYTEREGTPLAQTPTRILEVVTTTTYRALNQP